MAASTYQVIALAIYFVAMIAIGLWANSKNNSLDDYVLGGRQLSPTVAALSAGASDMSGWLLMGLPGAVYLSGLSQAWLAVGLTIGAWCNWKFVAPRLRSYTEVAGDAVTVPVFLSNRLHDTKVQGLLMLAALIAVPVVTIINLGGVGPVVESISQVSPDALSIFAGTTFAGIVSSLAWGLGYFGQPHIIVRFMAMRTPADAKSGRRIGISWMVLTVFGALSGAFMGIAYFARHPEASLTNPETAESVFLDLSQILFHPLVAGLILAAVLAAIMSTLSSQLIVCSSALVEDLYGIFSSKKLSASKSLWLGRAGVAIVALVAGALAWNPNSSILQLVAFAWAGFGSAFGPTVLLSLYWRKLTTQGALASMITGAVVAFAWGQSPMKSVLYEMVPGFASAMLVAIIVSLVTYKKNQVIDEEFDRAVELAKVK